MSEGEPATDVAPASETNQEKAVASTTPASEPRARRERKQAEFFTPDGPKGDGQKRTIPEGKGTKLSDIPNVLFHFSKVTGSMELVESIHSLLFKSKGKLSTRKKDIMAFSGYVYEDEMERGKYSEKLSKWALDDIHKFMDLLDIPRGSGNKAAKVSSVMDFLEKPDKQSETDKAEKAEKAKEIAVEKKAEKAKEKKAKAKERAGENKTPAAKKEKATEKKTAEKKTPAVKKEPAAKAKTSAKKAAAKDEAGPSATKRKAAAKETPRKRMKKDAGEAEDVQEPAEGPSDAELTKEMEAILDSAGDDFSMKDLLSKLQAKFKMSFQKRKPFLKELASDYLAKHQAEKPEEAAGDDAKEAADEEEAKAMETEVDAAAEQPKEEAEAGEPAADGAIAAPMEEDAKEPAAEAPTAEAGTAGEDTAAAAPAEVPAAEPEKEAVPTVPVEEKPVIELTAGEVSASAAAENIGDTAVEKANHAVDAAPPAAPADNGEVAPPVLTAAE